MELLVDSGAVDNVGDPRAFPEYKLRESDGSRNGLHYLAANNGKIKNEGELNLSCRSSEGMPFKLKMQGAGVSRPILSVIRLTESGKDVIFKKNGGIIRDTQTGVTTTFRRNMAYMSWECGSRPDPTMQLTRETLSRVSPGGPEL